MNQVIINLMKEYPEKFRDNYEIGSVYGTFPGAIWNGGRAVIGVTQKSDMEKIISTYNSFGVPVRFTWTNSLIEEKHLDDTYCNLIMSVADNGKNQVLVNKQILEDYLRKRYPDFKYISSTTKRITSFEELKKEYEKDYELVVLDYDLNHDESVINGLGEYAGRTEILVDEICFPGCPKRKAHYAEESRMQLSFDKGRPFDCPNTKVMPSFDECKKRPAFISKDDISDYTDKGFVNFKLVGRGLPRQMVMDSYIYYLVRYEHSEFIKKKLEDTLSKLTGATKR